MMLGRLSTLSVFLTYDIFNLLWIYLDVTPFEVKEHKY